VWQIINKLKNHQNLNKLGKNKITNLKNVAVHDTYAKGKSKFKNMLGNNILKLFRPVLEDKVENFKWKLSVGTVDITNLVLSEHTQSDNYVTRLRLYRVRQRTG